MNKEGKGKGKRKVKCHDLINVGDYTGKLN